MITTAAGRSSGSARRPATAAGDRPYGEQRGQPVDNPV